MKKYDSIIIDDEPKSVKLLTHFLDQYCPNIVVTNTAYSFKDAIQIIQNNTPEIVFIDIYLKEFLAFDILEATKHLNFHIIFISSYDKYAVEAIKYGPVGYLLKPFCIKELVLSVNKAIAKIETETTLKKEEVDIIAIANGDKVKVIKNQDIIFCEASGNYTLFHFNDGSTFLAAKNIGFYEEILPSNIFFRIHRRYIVNLSYIESLYKKDGGYCKLKNDITLTISRRKQEKLQTILNLK